MQASSESSSHRRKRALSVIGTLLLGAAALLGIRALRVREEAVTKETTSEARAKVASALASDTQVDRSDVSSAQPRVAIPHSPEAPTEPTEEAIGYAYDEEESAARAPLTRARHAYDDLARQKPENIVEIFSLLSHSGHVPAPVLEEGRRVTLEYVETRTELLEDALLEYIKSGGRVTQPPEIAKLRDLESSFRKQLDGVARYIPSIATLPDMLAATSHPTPFFALAEEAAPSAGPDEQ